MLKRRDGHTVPALFVFLLLGVFALMSLVLILFGARAYRGAVERSQAHNEQRVLGAYIRNNLRMADAEGCIRVDGTADAPVIGISDPADAGEYIKYIYIHDGMLTEKYTETARPFDPEGGEDICPADGMRVETDGALWRVTVTADGDDYVTEMALLCGEVSG